MSRASTSAVKRHLAASRPPTARKPKSISRKATKALINTHHLLEKRREQATAKGDRTEAARVDAEISALGGLERYQQASLQGQRDDRGGDSSRVLLQWLEPCLQGEKGAAARPLRMLEVGALSTQNACSKSGYFDIIRIDLNSQGEGIIQQDFMERPLPRDHDERFDIISLSLVLNFVPDPRQRGEMLRRTLDFLHLPKHLPQHLKGYFPSLFLVLPAPCISNSRYLDEERLEAMMLSFGYSKVASKATQRLVYYLWKRDSASSSAAMPFAKNIIRTGSSRNNFAIVIK
ncbi:hypothetical protein GQ53DRAFT_789334 [Thozetella sp. PMI_491]|nr:hypothetical protein GQ53DRAFT_789334 [Thozetella sp. PMI_491]